MRRLDLQDVAIARPHFEAAADRAVGADGLGLLGALGAHLRFHLGERKDRPIADRRLDSLDDIDHVVQRVCRSVGQVSRLPEHRFLHQRIARTHRDAVAARNTARTLNLCAAIPKHPRMVALPIDRQRLIHLHVLARLHTTPAQDALVRVIPIERIRHVLLIRLRRKRTSLVLNIQLCRRVVDRAVLVVVVAHRAVQHMVLQNPIERLALRDIDGLARGLHLHPCSHPGRRTRAPTRRSPSPCRCRSFGSAPSVGHSRPGERLSVSSPPSVGSTDRSAVRRVAWNLQSVDGELRVRRMIGGGIQK